MLSTLSKLVVELDPIANPLRLMQTVVDEIFAGMTLGDERKFGFGGVQQFILDMQFSLAVLDQFVTKQCNTAANEKCGKALRLYFLQNKDVALPLKVFEISTYHVGWWVV